MGIQKKRRPKGNLWMEILRKSVHALVGILAVLLIQTGLLDLTLLGIFTLFLTALVLFNYRYERETLMRVLSINRPDADVPGLDLIAYFVGMWLVLLLFPLPIALAAIMILALGDPVAHLVSRSFGGTEVMVTQHSYWYGTFAGAVAATLAAWLHVPFFPALVASCIAMFVEAGEVRIAEHHLDDNFTMPLVAGITLWVINYAFPF